MSRYFSSQGVHMSCKHFLKKCQDIFAAQHFRKKYISVFRCLQLSAHVWPLTPMAAAVYGQTIPLPCLWLGPPTAIPVNVQPRPWLKLTRPRPPPPIAACAHDRCRIWPNQLVSPSVTKSACGCPCPRWSPSMAETVPPTADPADGCLRS